MKPKRPPPPPDLLDVAHHQVPFGANPLSVTSLIHTTLIRALKRIPKSPERTAAMCQMVSEIMDLMESGADGLIVVRHPDGGADKRAKEPEPKNKPGLAVPDKPHR